MRKGNYRRRKIRARVLSHGRRRKITARTFHAEKTAQLFSIGCCVSTSANTACHLRATEAGYRVALIIDKSVKIRKDQSLQMDSVRFGAESYIIKMGDVKLATPTRK